MKSFAASLIVVVLAVSSFAAPAPEPSENELFEKAPEHDLGGYMQYDQDIALANSDLLRQKKSYGAASAPSYGAASAPSYAAPSYAAPSAPSYAAQPSYGAAPSRLIYSAPAPSIPCSKAIVVSCAPSVISAPCSAPPAHGSAY